MKKLKSKIKIKAIIAGIYEKDIKFILSNKNLKKNKVDKFFNLKNKFISLSEETKLFLNADLVWCVYKNTPFGSSGVFHLSNFYKKPVATNKDGLLGWYNKKYKLGPILDFTDKDQSNNSVKTILNLSKKKKIFHKLL